LAKVIHGPKPPAPKIAKDTPFSQAALNFVCSL
jgi:hypothetical protein